MQLACKAVIPSARARHDRAAQNKREERSGHSIFITIYLQRDEYLSKGSFPVSLYTRTLPNHAVRKRYIRLPLLLPFSLAGITARTRKTSIERHIAHRRHAKPRREPTGCLFSS